MRYTWYIVGFIVSILGLSLFLWGPNKSNPFFFMHTNRPSAQASVQPKQQEEWLTIFVHGTFGCLFGVFSFPAVLKDRIGSSFYKGLAGIQRKDPANFLDQPIMQPGLVKIEPSYNLDSTKGKYFLAYPLAQAFQDFSHYGNDKSLMTFYTYGWSGLLSQKQRRIDAVRFYNELTEELQRYHQVGKSPKIRLVAHSHGGNLCLNLAAINDTLTLASYSDIDEETADAGTNAALSPMYKYLKSLPNKKAVANEKDLKQFDYVPNKLLSIDELVLLGTPVQVETKPFFFSPTFKKIYHFYADSDGIQALDHISTKKPSLRQVTYPTEKLPKIRAVPTLIQSKITINYPRKKYALSHRDLWGISWHKNSNPLSPLPVCVITPLLIEALNTQPLISHTNDITIEFTDAHLKIYAVARGEQKISSLIQIKRNKFEEIKKNVKQWNPYYKEKA